MTITCNVRLSQDTGTLKAFADVEVHFSASVLSIHGLRVVETDNGKGPWVAYPQQAGKKEGKWYDIVKVSGKLHEEISRAVLQQYTSALASEKQPVAPLPGPVRAQIPGEEDIPF